MQEAQPTLLGSNSYFTELIILKCHDDVNHSGLESTLNRIRCSYLLVKGRASVKRVIRKCVICHIIQGNCIQPPSTPLLPDYRVSCDFPFQHVGVDYAGPLYRDPHGGEVFTSVLLILLKVV